MKTKEQKIIDKLYKEKEVNGKIDLGKKLIKRIRQEIKELEDDGRNSKN